MQYTGLSTDISYGYTYDAVGNIATYSAPGKGTVTYTYDALGQLLSAVGDETYTYTYDSAGNVLTANGHTYTYGAPGWPDLLSGYDGETIVFDRIGNPLSYYNGTRWTFTWKNGRSLSTATDGDTNLSFGYDANGLRTSKTVDGVTHKYYYASGQLMRETYGNRTLDFFYDANGNPYGLKTNEGFFLYITNLQGDVTHLINVAGDIVASYDYDPYGNIVSATGTMADINPLRYRGYYYDSELEMYYLQSRYYDPQIGRFINADVFASTGQGVLGCNMFAYCGNNPVNRYDDDGLSWKSIWNKLKSAVRTVLHAGNTYLRSKEVDTAAIGGYLLNMKKDSQGIYHANFDCWQQYFGYNDLYDIVFDLGTSMSSRKFAFTCGGQKYILWAWKGDYINLGAGAELGIYYGGGPHWRVDKGLAMNMSMTLKYKGRTIISYSSKTWWITGFNPRYINISASSLSVSFTVYFNSSAMYNAFRNSNPIGWRFNSSRWSASYTF